MIGKQVGQWTITAFAGHDKHKMRMWRCRCSCGYERDFNTSYLNSGQPSSCPECRASLRGMSDTELVQTLVGKVFGKYTVVGKAPSLPHGGRRWLCRCQCGRERIFLTANLSGNGKRRATQCPDCLNAQIEATNRMVTSIPDRFWQRFLGQAARRGLVVSLTKAQAETLFQQQQGCCALTGEPLWFTKLRTNYNRYTTASLDRIDSTQPYKDGNVQWVHKVMNMMKMSMPQNEFVDWCRKVAGGPSQSLVF